MNLLESIVSGNTARLDQILAKDPSALLNCRWSVTVLSGKEVSLTPLFLATVAGQLGMVQCLIERGAPLQLEALSGNSLDLFLWACLCPSLEKRQEVLSFLFDKELYKKIDPRLSKTHKAVALGQSIRSLSNNNYSSTYYSISLLSGTLQQTFNRLPSEKELSTLESMPISEVKTYRFAIHQFLARAGSSPSLFDPSSELYFAVILGDLEAVKRHPKDIIRAACLRNQETLTLVECAVRYNRSEIFEYLIKECNISLDGSLATRCAYMAASSGSVPMLRYLKESWRANLLSPIGYGPYKGEPPLYAAAINGNLEAFIELVDKEGADPHEPIREGETRGHTIAFIAAAAGSVDILKELSQRGVHLDQPLEEGGDEGRTPVVAAALGDSGEALRELSKQGIDVHKPLETGNNKGLTAAFIAAIKGRMNAVKALYGLGVNFLDPVHSNIFAGHTPVSIAAKKGHVDVLLYLRERRVNLWKGFESAIAPDSSILKYPWFPRVLEVFGIERSLHPLANPLATDRAYLHLSCLARSYEGVNEFLENGFSVSKGIDVVGRCNAITPLDALLAADYIPFGPLSEKERERIRIIQLLIEHGLDREETLKKVRELRPQLYSKLLTDQERSLEWILVEKSMLKQVLAGTLIPPSRQDGAIVFTDRNANHAITPSNVGKALRSSIDSLLFRKSISPRLNGKLVKLLSIEESPSSACKTEMTEEEWRLFSAVFERIEEISQCLGSEEDWDLAISDGGSSMLACKDDHTVTPDFGYISSAKGQNIDTVEPPIPTSSSTSSRRVKRVRKKRTQ